MTSETQSKRAAWLDAVGHRLWRTINSNFAIAVVGAVTAAVLANQYAVHQADMAQLAARRADLNEVMVELDMRAARLQIVSDQSNDRKNTPLALLEHDGARAMAIVKGDADTVTSLSEFKGDHLTALLSRAEFDAGLGQTDKSYLLTYTDLTDCAALQQTKFILQQIQPLIYYLKTRFQDGELPVLPSSGLKTNDPVTFYAELAKASQNAAASSDIISKSRGGAENGLSVKCK
jgi:hypothetical protein